jgi:hypothetical protein
MHDVWILSAETLKRSTGPSTTECLCGPVIIVAVIADAIELKPMVASEANQEMRRPGPKPLVPQC